MKKNIVLRPQDVAVLLKVVSQKANPWRTMDLANELFMSQSEISKSLDRSRFAGLIDSSKKNVHLSSLSEFIFYGVKYAFPEKPGEIVRGTATAHSAPPLSNEIQIGIDAFVWQDEEGLLRGQRIQPLYPGVIKAVKLDPYFYELIALVDAIRVGKTREVQLATELLRKRFQKK